MSDRSAPLVVEPSPEGEAQRRGRAGSLPGSASCLGGFAFELMAEAPGLGAGVDDVGAVGEPVDDGFGQPPVGEHLGPLAEGQVGCADEARPLVALGDHLEDELGGALGQGQVAKLIEHHELGAAVAADHARQLASRSGLLQLVAERGERGEAHPPPLPAGADRSPIARYVFPVPLDSQPERVTPRSSWHSAHPYIVPRRDMAGERMDERPAAERRPKGVQAGDFFRPWESAFNSFDAFAETLTTLFERWVQEHGRLFAWRGVVDASWPFHSSLYRRILWTSPSTRAPDESTVLDREGEVLTSVHRWGLHDGEPGRLSILSQLATLQHFGAPTRLIDVTMNAYIGLWFAVQPVLADGLPIGEDTDGRLFAIDITNRLINEDEEKRDWEDATHRPWKRDDPEWIKEWCSQTWAWRPPAFERRIAAQNGAFLFGGVPRTGIGLRWPKAPRTGSGWWSIDEVRRCVSVPLRFHVAEPRAGGVPRERGQPSYTFRISASAKPEIRERLRTLFGYQHSTIYPDFPGFSDFAEPHLRTSKP
jgi:FRG domain